MSSWRWSVYRWQNHWLPALIDRDGCISACQLLKYSSSCLCARCCLLPVVLNCHFCVSAQEMGWFPVSTTVVVQQGAPAEREKNAAGLPSLLYLAITFLNLFTPGGETSKTFILCHCQQGDSVCTFVFCTKMSSGAVVIDWQCFQDWKCSSQTDRDLKYLRWKKWTGYKTGLQVY